MSRLQKQPYKNTALFQKRPSNLGQLDVIAIQSTMMVSYTYKIHTLSHAYTPSLIHTRTPYFHKHGSNVHYKLSHTRTHTSLMHTYTLSYKCTPLSHVRTALLCNAPSPTRTHALLPHAYAPLLRLSHTPTLTHTRASLSYTHLHISHILIAQSSHACAPLLRLSHTYPLSHIHTPLSYTHMRTSLSYVRTLSSCMRTPLSYLRTLFSCMRTSLTSITHIPIVTHTHTSLSHTPHTHTSISLTPLHTSRIHAHTSYGYHTQPLAPTYALPSLSHTYAHLSLSHTYAHPSLTHICTLFSHIPTPLPSIPHTHTPSYTRTPRTNWIMYERCARRWFHRRNPVFIKSEVHLTSSRQIRRFMRPCTEIRRYI